MKIQIEQNEIEVAVREYMASQGIKVEGKALSVDFKMTRVDGGGLIAYVNIDEAAPAAPVKATTRAPRANTVGAAIEKQAEKAPAAVNKLPTAAEAIADAQARAAADAQAEKQPEAETSNQAADAPAATAEVAEEKAETAAEAKPATTTSLFG
jgi:hypothetical protein